LGWLCGDLVATPCHHVFHRECVPATGTPCPKCHVHICGEPLGLFCANFGEDNGGRATGSPRLALGGKLSALTEAVEDKRHILGQLEGKCQDTQTKNHRQARVRKEADSNATAKKAEHDRLVSGIDKDKKRKEQLLEDIQRQRERDMVMEYVEKIKEKSASPNEAFQYLHTYVNTAMDPGPLLTEVGRRLLQHHRSQVEKLSNAGRRLLTKEAALRSELARLSSRVTDHKRSKPRLGSDTTMLGRTRPSSG